jgi:DNA-cytosine methyltransferase
MKIGTFFSGIGSPEQALINLGIDHDIEFACEIDKYARETYLKNFTPNNMYKDITTLDMKTLPPVDLLVFGFPCQAFSLAGRRGGFDDTRGTLFYDALRYLREHKPRYFIAENVKGLLSHDNSKTFRTIIDCIAKTENYQFSMMPFDNLGYHIHYKVLNTRDFGVPQNRERIFIIGIRDDEDNNFNFPAATHLKLKLKDILEEKVDEKYFLSQKMVDGIYKSKFMERKPMSTDGVCKTLKVGGDTPCFKDDGVVVHSLYPRSSKTGKGGTGHLTKEDGTTYCLDTGSNQAIEVKSGALRTYPRTNNPDKDREDGRKKQLELRSDDVANSITTHQCDSLVVRQLNPSKESGGKQPYQQNRVYDIEGIAPALVSELGGDRSHNIEVMNCLTEATGNRAGSSSEFLTSVNRIHKNTGHIRRLTCVESERLQGFPDDFTAGVSDTQRYKQLGNTITVNVIQGVINNLLK